MKEGWSKDNSSMDSHYTSAKRPTWGGMSIRLQIGEVSKDIVM